MLGTGVRPGEVFQLRWEHLLLNGSGGLVQIVAGKSRAARRLIPMVPEVYGVLIGRHIAQGEPLEGWVFPSGSRSGHFEQDSAKNQHAAALKLLNKRTEEDEQAHQDKKEEDEPRFRPFEPYCLRHTALTRLAESGCDAFTLARIAGHSSIMITQRYCHPQADAIERAFAKLSSGKEVVTEGGHHEKRLSSEGESESFATDSQ